MASHNVFPITPNASNLELDNKASFPFSQRFFQLFRSRPQEHHQHCDYHAQRDRAIRSTQSSHSSPINTLSVDEALDKINDKTPPPVAFDTPVTTSVIGSVIAEDVYAETMVPSCPVSAIDGYAIVLEQEKLSKEHFPTAFTISTNNRGSLEPLQPGTVVKTTIGARLPPNANAVIKEEDTTVGGMGQRHIKITTENIVIGQNVRDSGSCVSNRSRIFARGDALTPLSGAISLLVMAGVRTIRIFKKPRVGLLSINDGSVGNDLRMHNASRFGVLSSLISWGFEIEDLGTLCSTMHGELNDGTGFGVDMILILNDASMNEVDLQSNMEVLGGFIHFDHVPMKPSGHVTFATIPASSAENTLAHPSCIPAFTLPSDPVSALVALNLFVLPSLNKMSGLDQRLSSVRVRPRRINNFGLPRVAVVLTHHIPLDPKKPEYHLAVVTGSLSDARLYATSISTEDRSARDMLGGSRIDANALIILRAGRGVCLKGEIVEALLMGPCSASDTRLIC